MCVSVLYFNPFRAEYDLFQIELSKNYGTTEWREDIKTCLMKAGAENTQVVFLFSDTQIKSESMLEDLNNILNSGDVPNIYAFEDLDRIYNEMKPIVQDAGQQPTKSNLFSAYTKRVRSNIHVVICMRYVSKGVYKLLYIFNFSQQISIIQTQVIVYIVLYNSVSYV